MVCKRKSHIAPSLSNPFLGFLHTLDCQKDFPIVQYKADTQAGVNFGSQWRTHNASVIGFTKTFVFFVFF